MILKSEPFEVIGLPKLENATPHLASVKVLEYHPIRFKDGTESNVPEHEWDVLYVPA